MAATAALVVLAGALGLALAQSGGEAEVRITAQRLEDGRTEFGLQQRVNGEWGERILPRRNLFPAEIEPGRWLNSTPVTLEPAPIVRELGAESYDDNRITTLVRERELTDGVTGIETRLQVVEDGQHKYGDQPLRLTIVCVKGRVWHRFGLTRVVPGTDVWGSAVYQISVAPSADGGGVKPNSRLSFSEFAYRAEQAPEMFGYSAAPGWSVEVPVYILAQLHSADQVVITITGADDESVTATFSMNGVFETPIQPNIDRCGTYY